MPRDVRGRDAVKLPRGVEAYRAEPVEVGGLEPRQGLLGGVRARWEGRLLRGIVNTLRAAIWLCTTAAVGVSGLACSGAPRQPNIIFVLVDDMGWVDSSVYGSQYYRTPNLERLAAHGMRFTDAYAASPVCSPTRASILTGKYPARLHMTAGARGKQRHYLRQIRVRAPTRRRMVSPRSLQQLPREEFTLAEALRSVGYRTAFIGKWHLGGGAHVPAGQGFDVSIAASRLGSAKRYHSPYRLPGLRDGPRGEFLTDRLTDEALSYIEANRDTPFFLCLWHYAVHAPWGHKKEITRRWKHRRDPTGRHGNAIMGSIIESVDESLGRIIDKLDELGIADDTIVVFTSDNGGTVLNTRLGLPPTNNAPLGNGKASLYEGGIRVPCIIVWPGVTAPGSVSAAVISSIDFYPTLLEAAGARPRREQVIDGTSLLPVLQGGRDLDREAIFFHLPHYGRWTELPPATSVRNGPWKLIRLYGAGKHHTHVHELYNLDEDLGEENDLAAQMPERVTTLAALIDEHLDETHAQLPIRNPYHDPMSEGLHRRDPFQRGR